MDIQVTVTDHGPIFDGRAEHEIEAFLDDAKDAVSRQAYADVSMYMNAFFKHPTPYYETQVIVERQGNDRVVHDRGIIYGPWLAGVGSRNRTTRFKGYAHWRLATQNARSSMPQTIEPALRRHLEAMQ